MVSNKELDTILNSAFTDEANNVIGLDISDLNFKNYQYDIQEFSSSTHDDWQFIDFGLSEENICLYLYCMNDNGVTDFCIVNGKPDNIPNIPMHDYAICFREDAIPSHEEVIKKAENIKAIYYATQKTRNLVFNFQKHRDLSSNDIQNILSGRIRSSLHNRRRMWHEIEEGLRRILGPKPIGCNRDILQESQYTPVKKYLLLSIHGDQLRDFIRSNCYAVDSNNNDINVDALILGHFHIEMIMIRFNTLIILNGHWLESIHPHRDEFLTHIGYHRVLVETYIKSRIHRFLPG